MKSSKPKPESQQQPLAQPSGLEPKASSLTLSAQNLGALNNHHRSAANASLNQKQNLVNTSAGAAGSNAHANASTNSSANKANAHYYQVWYSTSLQVYFHLWAYTMYVAMSFGTVVIPVWSHLSPIFFGIVQ